MSILADISECGSEMNTNSITIREVSLTDAAEVAHLAGELGYPCEPHVMTERLEATLQQDGGKVVYVAVSGDRVVGWIEVAVTHHIASGRFGEITGLVVSGDVRSSGIGRELVGRAERWAASQGVGTMVVRSRTTRQGAHRFYLREGYSLAKTSTVFVKQL